MHTYKHTRTRARTSTHAQTRTHAHTHTHVNTHTHTLTRTHTHKQTHTHTHILQREYSFSGESQYEATITCLKVKSSLDVVAAPHELERTAHLQLLCPPNHDGACRFLCAILLPCFVSMFHTKATQKTTQFRTRLHGLFLMLHQTPRQMLQEEDCLSRLCETHTTNR